MSPGPVTQPYEAGGAAGVGTFACVGCGCRLSLDAAEPLPECPRCGGDRFRRASIFREPTVDTDAVAPADRHESWIQTARAAAGEGVFLAFESGEGTAVRTVPLPRGWSRIGRSAAAHVRLDDPTVSRRHALVIRTDDDEVRVMDDRSLNGVFVNGERVEWAALADGDELAIGRYRLHLIDNLESRDEPHLTSASPA